MKEPGPDLAATFVELIHTLLHDPDARLDFFSVNTDSLFYFLTNNGLIMVMEAAGGTDTGFVFCRFSPGNTGGATTATCRRCSQSSCSV